MSFNTWVKNTANLIEAAKLLIKLAAITAVALLVLQIELSRTPNVNKPLTINLRRN